MIFRDIWTVAKKELKAGLSDKVVLFQVICMPFLVVFGYVMLMVIMGQAQETGETQKEMDAYYVNAPAYMEDGLKELKLQKVEIEQVESLKEEIAQGECALLLWFPEDFAFAENGSQNLSNIDIWFNSTKSESYEMYYLVTTYLNAYQPKLFSVNADEDIMYDLGDVDEVLRNTLSGLMPIILIMAIFMVCMNLAAESIAGDKERGFLNTMLIAPVKRSSIAAGKAVYLLLVAMLGGVSAFIGLVISLPKLAEAMELEGFTYSTREYLFLFLITITAVFALVSILLIISTLSKEIKQATNIASVVMVVLMVGGMLASTEGFRPMIDQLGQINHLIPAWNAMLFMQDIIRLEYEVGTAWICCGMNLLFSVIAILVTGKCFESEKIIND